jgi:uncharacterized protein (DUF697 family)/nitrate reductase NapAB chaperone NapD
MNIFDLLNRRTEPDAAVDMEPVFQYQLEHLPTLWLFGKTGAGKSSLIRSITGDSTVEIGRGFRPCTTTSQHYDFPQDKPLLRFLDTRGLAESDYQADEDIAACQHCSHVLIVVMKAEDPEQSLLLQHLKQIKKHGMIRHIVLVHSGTQSLSNEEQRQRCISHHQQQVDEAWGSPVQAVAVDFACDDTVLANIDGLRHTLAELLPLIRLLTVAQQRSAHEEKHFETVQKEALWYAAAAAASDAVPALGLVSVPLLQLKMLHALAQAYHVPWTTSTRVEFSALLGVGFGVHYLGALGSRQLVKFIPVYGQTAGAATASAVSFATTYALARAACKYLHAKQTGEDISAEAVKETYQQALFSSKHKKT